MSFTDEYYKLMQPKKKKKDEEKSFSDEYRDLVGTSKPSASDAKQYLKSFNGALDAVSSKGEIAPTFGGSRGGGFSSSRGGGFGGDGTFYTTGSGDGGNFGFDNRKWYEKGAFEDGYDFGDITRTILGTSKDQGESLEDTIAKNDALISKNTKILSSTKMDGTDHSVLEEMQAIAGMKSGKEKRERKAAVLSKMEELGISASDYGLYSGDGNFNIDTFLDWTDNAAMSGLAAFNKGVTATADLLLGNPLKALGWENNPVSSMADYYSDTYDTYRYNADLYRTKLWGDSGGASFGQSAIEGVTGALPTAILALMTGGASLGATTSSLTTTAAYETGGLLTKAGLTTSAMMKNPQFWLSFSRELGTDYEEAKEMGASDTVAALGATVTSLFNSGIEIGLDGLSGIQGLPQEVAEEGGSKLLKWAISSAEEGGEEALQKFVNEVVTKTMYDHDADILDPKEYATEAAVGAISGMAIGGGQIGVQGVANTVQAINAKKLTENEQAVVDKVYQDEIAKKEEQNGRELTNREKKTIYKDILNQLEKGGISIEKIEEVLGGETYKSYQDTISKEQEVLDELSELYEGDELSQQVEDFLKNSESNQLRKKLGEEVFGLVKGDRLVESYNERGRRFELFEADLTQYSTKQQEIVQKAIDSGVLNNTNRSHELVNLVAKIYEDKGASFDFTNNKKLLESGFAVAGKQVNGFVSNGNITLNIDSANALQSTVGHEITHVLEGTEVYTELQNILFEYAKSRKATDSKFDSEYKERLHNVRQLYKDLADYQGVKGFENIKKEVVADLVGDYIFSDSAFIHNLSTQHRNVFQKIYDEIKYLCKVATAGSKEARELEKVKRAFEDAYRENGKGVEGMKYSLGYHAGDLGKSEFYDMQSADRSSGHFGTGTYFVGDEAQINKNGYENRPHHAVEFDNYNLYKVRSDDDGYKLHRSLRLIDGGIKQEFLDAAIAGDLYASDLRRIAYERADDYAPEVFDDELEDFVRPNLIDANIRALTEVASENGVEIQSYDEWLADESYPMSDATAKISYYEYLDDTLNSVDEERNNGYPEFNRAYSDLWIRFGKRNVDKALQDVIDYDATMQDSNWDTQKKSDSLATVFMKSLGYEGIDTRGTHLDDTEYGSVIYDLKGEDAKRKAEIGTAKYSLSDSDGKQLSKGQAEYFKDSKSRDLDGNLKIMYQGGNGDFTVFDRKKSSYSNLYGRGFYFTDSESHAKQYGNARAFYLDIKNPVSTTERTITEDQMRKFLEAVAEDEDYGLENYGYGATVDSVLNSIYSGKSDFAMLYDVSQTAIGDMVAAVELFNEVNDTDFDGLILDTETVTFRSNQAKSVDNLNPTGNEDINLSLSSVTTAPTRKLSGIYGSDVKLQKPTAEAEAVAPVAEPVQEDIAPIPEAAVAEEVEGVAEDVAPVVTPARVEYEAIRPKPVKQPRMVRADRAETKPSEKQRKWVKTSTESDAVDGKVLPEDLSQEKIYYQPIPNKVTLGKANAKLDGMGYETAVAYFNSQFANKSVSLEDVALGERLIQEAIKRGDNKTAGELIQNVSILGTELGQKVQALSIIKRLTPEGQLGMLQKTVERGKTKGDKAFEGVEITQEMIDHILSVYGKDGTYNQDELNKAVEDVKQKIADQMKVTAMDKVNAWRYLSMLGNPKTHIRNLVSNLAMRGTLSVKNAVARTIETIAPIKNRTKTWKPASAEVREFAKQTTAEMKDIISGESKYSENASIKEKRSIFKNKILNGVYEFNSDLLGKEDWWFSRPAFANSLSEFLTANGITTKQDIQNNPKIVENAKQYALEQSQIATFRQYSWLANKINEIERKNAATNIAVGAIVPFKKTPINIAKAGLNYSPLGFAKTLTYDISQVKKGNMEASELVDHLAQNVTGSALTLVGYLLASAGLLNGAGEDDKEGKYDYQLGEQAYSINIGDATFSLSWLSPVAMPLFVGANAYEQLVEGKEWNGDVVVETLAQTLDPLSEMSFISSLDSVLSSYDSGIQKFAGIGETMAQNYITQFIPTLSSQIATVMDDTKRSTKVAGDSNFKFVDQTINNLIYKIPFLRETLEPSTDIWGNEIKQTEAVMTRAFETFLAPYAKRENIATEVDEEIKGLYGETGDDGLIPSIPHNYVNYDGEKHKMSAKEYTEFKQVYGQTAFDLLEELFDTETYANADSESRADMVNKVYDYAMDEAKREYFAGNGIEFTNATKDGKEYYDIAPIKGAIENDMTPDEYSFSVDYPGKYKFFKDNGISYDTYKNADEDGKRAYTWAYENPEKFTMSKVISDDFMEFYNYKNEMNEFDAKDASGESVSGLKKERVIDYINGLDLDYGQKIILFRSMYDSKEDKNTYNADIVEYLDSRSDISYEEMVEILEALGMTVSGNTVTW